MSGGEPWYRDGLRFACTQCGNCCSGPPGAVWVEPEECRALAEQLSLELPEFLSRFTREVGSRRSLEERVTEHGNDCIFLDRESAPGRALCGVYEARPSQCRTWPFWRENLASRDRWNATRQRVPCPGMDAPNGRVFPLVEIRVMLDEDTKRSEQAPW
ncbi:MAG: YkgJ family cysteine cluster protein [Phycisphaerae bacterium]|nr:YkgJ family cysteine cluster protein [Phycisphaerae bacterium]